MSARSTFIRVATPAETAAIASIINRAFSIETFLEGTRTDEAQLSEMMGKGIFLLACDSSERLVASVYVELRGERGYFGMLAVDPAHQGSGIGRAMVESVEDYCRQRGCKFMDISVLSLRTELPPFYRKLGYVETGTDEFHPSRPLKPGLECHLIIMSKPL